MFRNPFSFEGRIRRTEYGFTNIIFAFAGMFIFFLGFVSPFLYVAFLPLSWFVLVQTIKRCHDLNKSGWWQLVPFYAFWLLFAPGDVGPNRFGPDPKQQPVDMPGQMVEQETVIYEETIVQEAMMPEVVVVPVIQTEPVYINTNQPYVNNHNAPEEEDNNDQYDNSQQEYDDNRDDEDQY